MVGAHQNLNCSRASRDLAAPLSGMVQNPSASTCCDQPIAAWRCGNSVGRINEVTLRRARLVLGWVTCLGSTPGGGTLFRYVTNHAGRLSLSSFRGR